MPDSPEKVRDLVRERYGKAASRQPGGCCGGGRSADSVAESIGYSSDEIGSVPDGANLGLGCGNPNALAALQPGETVLDLGSGAGFDALIAAPRVGPTGRVIGVDMTPEMLERARTNAVEAGYAGTVEFREGTIEALPVAAGTVDVIISNCVINLSPDKPAVFREAFRVLKPGGRLALSDIVLSEPLPEDLRDMAAGYVACLSGALQESEYVAAMTAAGFEDVSWTRTPASMLFDSSTLDPEALEIAGQVGEARLKELADTVWSYRLEARKP
ncbi:MAG: arsenite methyltransferase [Acidobacteria bacterium]|uniref:Arsenite methyltransferase n=1 Tax=Candidatus Polarisedimenticola svalbardensis TaxID=2886004 RepID=A0A8J6Y6E8_9BACT|nr:arsenite methyltransferase [Candidatus Polarisedimenticola svalbardensis]